MILSWTHSEGQKSFAVELYQNWTVLYRMELPVGPYVPYSDAYVSLRSF